MPSIKTALKAIVGRTVATEHATLLAAITDREQRLREAPRIKARISDCRERVRGNESRQVKLNSALRGYAEDPKKWASHDRDARAERAELHRANEALAREIAADEKALSEIAAFALPAVNPDVLRFHNERLADAQATVAKIRDALDAARGELSALEATPGPAAELRRELSEALAGQALGTVTPEAVEALEVRLSQAETVTTTTGAKVRRIEATITGLEQRLSLAQADLDRLTSATPIMQAECLAPEIAKAETAYARSLADLVASNDTYRALRHMLSAINPDTAFPLLAEPTAALRDAGQTRLAAALEREQARLSAMGI